MSPTTLARLTAIARDVRRLNADVRRAYGDDGTRYPRDYYRPLELTRKGLAS